MKHYEVAYYTKDFTSSRAQSSFVHAPWICVSIWSRSNEPVFPRAKRKKSAQRAERALQGREGVGENAGHRYRALCAGNSSFCGC